MSLYLLIRYSGRDGYGLSLKFSGSILCLTKAHYGVYPLCWGDMTFNQVDVLLEAFVLVASYEDDIIDAIICVTLVYPSLTRLGI